MPSRKKGKAAAEAPSSSTSNSLPAPAKRGRKPKVAAAVVPVEEDIVMVEDEPSGSGTAAIEPAPVPTRKGKKSRKAKAATPDKDEIMVVDSEPFSGSFVNTRSKTKASAASPTDSIPKKTKKSPVEFDFPTVSWAPWAPGSGSNGSPGLTTPFNWDSIGAKKSAAMAQMGAGSTAPWLSMPNFFGGGSSGKHNVPVPTAAHNPYQTEPLLLYGSSTYPPPPGSGPPPLVPPMAGTTGFKGHPFSTFPTGMHAGLKGWDPLSSTDWDSQQPLPICRKRMQHDLASAMAEEDLVKIYLNPDENDITKLTVLIIGPANTPYEGGNFQFFVRVPPNYPLMPPRVRNMTTEGGRTRFGPNFYADGKVCLSILGTWSGPSWTAALNLLTMLQSVQSLLSDAALKNEPGFSNYDAKSDAVVKYDRCIQHETIRIAVVANLEQALERNDAVWPEKFRQAMYRNFHENVASLMSICENNKKFDNQQMSSSLGGGVMGSFQWSNLLGKLKSLKKRVPQDQGTSV